MKSFWKNYRMAIMLLGALIVGGSAGVIFGPAATVVKPLGDIFVNLMFMIIVPLVFFSIASAIANMDGVKRLGKIMGNTAIVFFITATVSACLALVGTILWNPLSADDAAIVSTMLETVEVEERENLSVVDQLVQTVTVSDFSLLLSKSNMLQLIVFSVLFGLATSLVGEKGRPIAEFLSSGTTVMMKIVSIIMYYAPIGLGAYFAAVIGDLGPQLLEGYARVFLLYIILTVVYFFGFFTLYAFLAGGKLGVVTFWKNAVGPAVTSLATCSSAASIPANLEATRRMGVPKDIAETVIPLGANTHKDGSVIGGVLKIAFIFVLFGRDITDYSTIISILTVAFLVGAVMGAIPGGGMIGEMLILSIFGFPPEVLPLIAVISTIIDAPATLLNSTGNTVCAMMVARLVEGRDWLVQLKSAK